MAGNRCSFANTCSQKKKAIRQTLGCRRGMVLLQRFSWNLVVEMHFVTVFISTALRNRLRCSMLVIATTIVACQSSCNKQFRFWQVVFNIEIAALTFVAFDKRVFCATTTDVRSSDASTERNFVQAEHYLDLDPVWQSNVSYSI